MAAKGAIALRNVTKRYGREPVVDALSVDIAPGEFFSLLGPSGSGKTTTLLMIAGFADVDEGTIAVDGQDVSATPPERRGFGMVFQNYAIFPHLDVFENVAFPLRARRMAAADIEKRVGEALSLVRLDRLARRFSRELSGGQQQRVAIARAIVYQPSVVLMDEPLGALDKNLRYEMQVEIKDIQRRLGMTVVYVTHDQEEAMNMSDRIAIMNSGRIEQVGRPAHIYENPATPFIARFLGEANLVEGTVTEAMASADGAGGFSALRAGGVVLYARDPVGAATGAQRQLFVRPERIALSPTADEPAAPQTAAEETRNRIEGFRSEEVMNVVDGRVIRTSFLGNVLRHAVAAEGAQGADAVVLTVDVQNASMATALPLDARVRLSWRASDSVLL